MLGLPADQLNLPFSLLLKSHWNPYLTKSEAKLLNQLNFLFSLLKMSHWIFWPETRVGGIWWLPCCFLFFKWVIESWEALEVAPTLQAHVLLFSLLQSHWILTELLRNGLKLRKAFCFLFSLKSHWIRIHRFKPCSTTQSSCCFLFFNRVIKSESW